MTACMVVVVVVVILSRRPALQGSFLWSFMSFVPLGFFLVIDGFVYDEQLIILILI